MSTLGGRSLHFWHLSHCTQFSFSSVSFFSSFFLFFFAKPSPITTSCFAIILSLAFWAAARPLRAIGTMGGPLGVTGARGDFADFFFDDVVRSTGTGTVIVGAPVPGAEVVGVCGERREKRRARGCERREGCCC